MNFKTILLCINDHHSASRLTDAGCALARKFGAHLVGVYVLPTYDLYPSAALDLPASVIETYERDRAARAEEIGSIFERKTASEDFVSEWRVVEAGGTNREDRLIEHAHCADLVVVAQAETKVNGTGQHAAISALLRRSGRPVLVLPYAGTFDTFGNHALVGWSATREASRAVHDAIPFMRDGGQATIMWVSQGSQATAYLESTAHQIATCLDRHGVAATVTQWQRAQISVADALLNEASDRGADLIVTGAFGHSRFYDFVIGAATTALLDRMTLPVLFSK